MSSPEVSISPTKTNVRHSARPPWMCYDVQRNGITEVRKLPVGWPERSAGEASQLSGTNRVGERGSDDRPATYVTMSEFVTMGPVTQAPMVLRSQVSEPLTSWTNRLPDRPYNGMPNPLSDSVSLSIDTSEQDYKDPRGSLPVVSPTAAHSRSPLGRICKVMAPTRGRGDLSSWGHALLSRDVLPSSIDLTAGRSVSSEVTRDKEGRIVGFEQVGAMDHHARQAPLERQYSIPAMSAEPSLKFYNVEDRYNRLVQRDSPTHKFHWRSHSSPSLQLWQGPSQHGSPTRSPVSRPPEWGNRTRWHA